MAFDRYARVGIACEPLCLPLQGCLIFGIDIEPVSVEENAIAKLADCLQKIFLTSRNNRTCGRRCVGRLCAIIRAFGRGWQNVHFLFAASRDKRGGGQQ